MQAVPRTLLLSFLLLGSACSGGFEPGHPPRRDGPEFSVAFPDAAELVRTSNPDKTRSLLATVPLPETAEHHDQLLRVLNETAELSTDHLLLLTEAVAIPLESGNFQYEAGVHDNEYFHWSRTTDGFAPKVDELLLAGIDKLNDPSPANLGRMLGKAQSKEALLEIVAHLEAGQNSNDWDDGSGSDLAAMLGEARVDRVREEICLEALLPAGRFGSARVEAAIQSMSFDDGRLSILRADYDRRQTLPSSLLVTHVESMVFDDARVQAVREGATLVENLGGKELLALVELADFDDARVKIAKTLAEYTTGFDPGQAQEIVSQASFDDGRRGLLEALLKGPFPEVGGEELITFVETASFDDGRIRVAELLQPHVRPTLDAKTLLALLQMTSFDSGREELVSIFEADLQALPAEDRVGILECFSFDSGRKSAIRQLHW